MTDHEIKELRRKIGQRRAYLELWEHKVRAIRENKTDILREMEIQLEAAEAEAGSGEDESESHTHTFTLVEG